VSPLEITGEPQIALLKCAGEPIDADVCTELQPHEKIQAAESAAMPSWVNRGRVPSLDGFRALSIALVMAAHLTFNRTTRGMSHFVWLRPWGGTGVDIFFFISGFLITLLLLREMRENKTISLRNFYMRRVLRIMPAYCVYLFVLALLCGTGLAAVGNYKMWIAAATYTSDIALGIWPKFGSTCWNLAHTWSLSVEEHFYLLWPALLVFLRRRHCFGVLLLSLCISPILRYLLWRFAIHYVDIDYSTLTRSDPIVVGCIAAFLATSAAFWRRLEAVERHWPTLTVGATGMLILSQAVLARSGKYELTLQEPVESVCIGILVIMLATHPRSRVGGLLNSRIVVSLGMLSYSLYLWQQLFLNPYNRRWFNQWPQNLLLALAAACLSYFVVERTFLRLKDRLGHRSR
jgi:peptidoglycan/LPS O-acetylase OafA/YrhL